jgi:hypothetical protein
MGESALQQGLSLGLLVDLLGEGEGLAGRVVGVDIEMHRYFRVCA